MKKYFIAIFIMLILISGCMDSSLEQSKAPSISGTSGFSPSTEPTGYYFQDYNEYTDYIASKKYYNEIILAESFLYIGAFDSGSTTGSNLVVYRFYNEENDIVDIDILRLPSDAPQDIREYLENEGKYNPFANMQNHIPIPDVPSSLISDYTPELFNGNDLSVCMLKDEERYVVIDDVAYCFENGKLKNLRFRYKTYLLCINLYDDSKLPFSPENPLSRLLNYQSAETAIQELKDSIVTVGDKK